MSLSKFGTELKKLNILGRDNDTIPKWQLALLIGAPVLILGLGGFWWWRSTQQPSLDRQKKPGSKKAETTSSSSSKTTTPAPLKDDPLKPVYLKLKDEGNEMFKNGKYQEALERYTKAIEEETPADKKQLATLFQNRAAVFEKLQDFSSVIKECTAAVGLDSKYVKALTRRAKAYRQTGFLDEALEDVTAVCILEQFTSQSSVQLADDILKSLGEEAAANLLKNRKLVAPSHHSVNAFLRSFYNDPITKLWNASAEDGAGDSEIDGVDSLASSPFRTALVKLKEKDYDTIIELCTAEIEGNPTSKDLLEAIHLRGTFLFLWGCKEKTKEDLMKVAEATSASNELRAAAYVKLGSFYALQDENNDYAKCFEKAEELTPDNVDVFHHRGQVLLTKGLVEEAVQQLGKAADLCPEFALAAASHQYVLYRKHVSENNYDGKEDVMRKFIKLVRRYPDSPDVHNLYGQILIENQRYAEANKEFDRVLELEPKNASILVHKAMAEFQRTNNVSEAISSLEASLKLDDRNEFVYETLGTLQLQTGNLDEAVKSITKALQYAKSFQEMMMLSSLKKAAEVQVKIKEKIGLETPMFPPVNGMPMM